MWVRDMVGVSGCCVGAGCVNWCWVHVLRVWRGCVVRCEFGSGWVGELILWMWWMQGGGVCRCGVSELGRVGEENAEPCCAN